MIEGAWVDRSAEVQSTDGSFIRKDTAFRNWITADGAPGPSGDGGFKAVSGRYHLYVSYACPWAHRTLIFRELKGLEDHVSVSVVHPLMYEMGWELTDTYPGATGDPVLGKVAIYEIYLAADPKVTSRASVPVLWDKQQNKNLIQNLLLTISRKAQHAATLGNVLVNNHGTMTTLSRLNSDAVQSPLSTSSSSKRKQLNSTTLNQ